MATYLMILPFLLGTTVLAQSGTHFVYENRIYASYSSWVISYSVELAPYLHHLQTIQEEINTFRNDAEIILQRPPTNESVFHQSRHIRFQIMRLLKEETQTFVNEFSTIKSLIHTIKTFTQENEESFFSDRNKRAILPFVGKVMSFLFGVSTVENVNRIRSSLVQLGNRQEQVIDVLATSFSLINKTNQEIHINRQAISRIANATAALQIEFRAFYTQFYMDLFPEFVYVQLISRVHAVFNIISSTMRQFHLSLNNLLLHLQSSLQGKLSPSLIPPSQFVTVLTRVQSELPADIQLPYPLSKDGLLKYYQYIQPMVVPARNSFHIVMAIPLMHSDTEYEIHRAVQVPVPHPQGILGAQNVLETEYFAISRDHNHFINLNVNEVLHCLDGPICKFVTPQLSVMKFPQCIISLYLHDEHRTKTLCKKDIIKMLNVPTIKYLFPHHWLISNARPFSITKHCADKTENIQIQNVEILNVKSGCSAVSDYFTIPLQVSGSTSAEQEIKFYADMEIARLSPNIWNQSKLLGDILLNSTNELLDIPKELPQLQNIPLDYLHAIVNRHRVDPIKVYSDSSLAPWQERSITFGTLLTILAVLFAIGVIIQQKRLCFRKQNEPGPVTYVPYPKPDGSVKFSIPEPLKEPIASVSVPEGLGKTIGL